MRFEIVFASGMSLLTRASSWEEALRNAKRDENLTRDKIFKIINLDLEGN